MNDFPLKKITIYCKTENGYKRTVKEASFRNTSILNKDNYGFSSTDDVIVRIFDIKGFNTDIYRKTNEPTLEIPLDAFLGETWSIQKGDVVVNGEILDEIKGTTPITELSKQYGKDNVYKINKINVLIYEDKDLQDLNHVKLGCI